MNRIDIRTFRLLCAHCFLVIGVFFAMQHHSSAQSIFTESENQFVSQWLLEAVQNEDQDTLAAGQLLAQAHAESIEGTEFLLIAKGLELSNTSLLTSLITHCNRDSELNDCDLAKYTDSLKGLDANNAYPFALASLYYEQVGNTTDALANLKQAASKRSFDDYVIPRAAFLVDKLEKIGYPQENLLERAFFYGGDNFALVYQDLLELCEKFVEISADWKTTCIELGELMENQGRTFIAVRVGLAIQRSMYSFDPADEPLLNAVQRRRAFTHRWRVLLAENYESLLAAGKEEFFQDQIDHDEIYAVNQAFQRESGRADPDSFNNRNRQQ